MRITYNTIYSNVVKYIEENYDKLSKIQEEVSSGKKINSISQDSIATATILKLNDKIDAINQFSKNITTGSLWLKTTDSSIMQLKSITDELHELATQGATDTYTYEQRKMMAEKATVLADNIMDIVNTKINGKYIFSGFKVNKNPYKLKISVSNSNYSIEDANFNFDLNIKIKVFNGGKYKFSVDGGNTWLDNNGNGYNFNSINPILGFAINSSNPIDGDSVDISMTHEYQGDNGKFQIEIDESQKVKVNLTGKEVFTLDNENNIFKIAGNLWAGLVTNNRKLIQDQIEKISKYEKTLLAKDSEIGVRQDLIENFQTDFLNTKKEDYSKILSKIQDTDMAEAMTQLAKQQIVYQASLKTAAMISNLTILNFI